MRLALAVRAEHDVHPAALATMAPMADRTIPSFLWLIGLVQLLAAQAPNRTTTYACAGPADGLAQREIISSSGIDGSEDTY